MDDVVKTQSPEDGSAKLHRPLKCAVITPVGPGHEGLVGQAQASVHEAVLASRGPFTEVLFVPMPDLDGKLGRSRRRNDGIDFALANGIDWIFFLDADDLMVPDAFARVTRYIEHYDAVFGLIAELVNVQPLQGKLRPEQLAPTTDFIDILRYDPFLSIQMGHFVRTQAAAAIRFDVDMNTGEDFKYYLELWQRFRCAKVDGVFFLNRRAAQSTGPRSADPAGWRSAVSRVFEEFAFRNGVKASFRWEGHTVQFAISNPMDLIQKHFLFSRFFEAEELRYLRQIVPPHATIVEVGANVGNHLVYYGMFLQPKKIIPIELNPKAITLLKMNIELNRIGNVDTSLLGFGIGEKYGRFDLLDNAPANIGAARLTESDQGRFEVYPLDAKLTTQVDFIKIDVEWMEMEALRGAEQLVSNSRPIIFIEVMNANTEAFEQWVGAHDYKVTKIFPYVNAKNYVLVPGSHTLAPTVGTPS